MSTGTLNGQELELFKIGDYTGLGKGTYTAADMQGIVERYAAAGEAPMTIGHVKSDKEPAYGWIKSVRFSGDTLYGTPGDVDPELDKLHQQKRYRNRSVNFARDKDGNRYLHHVAILGATPPECKGLKEATFSTNQYEEFTTKESNVATEEQQKADEQKRFGDYLRDFFSSFGADKSKPKDFDEEALTARLEAKFSAKLDEERKAREAAEARFSASEGKTAADLRASKAEADLKAAGCWVPAYEKSGLRETFSALALHGDERISFSAADGTEQKPDLLDALVGVLKLSGRIVPAGRMVEFSAADGKKQSAPLPDGNGMEVDPDSAAFSAMVSARASKDNIAWNAAYDKLKAEGVRPMSGSSAAGAV